MDFPKTIYISNGNFVGEFFAASNFAGLRDGEVAIYTLKEVKKKVTEVKLEDL